MAQLIGGEVTLNGQTWVTIAGPPGSAKAHQVLSAKPRNKDSVAHIFELRKNKNGTFTELFESESVPAGKNAQLIDNCVTLDATDETLEARTAETTTTTESKVDVSIFEAP